MPGLLDQLSEDLLRDLVEPAQFKRGEQLFLGGQVREPSQLPRVGLTARVADGGEVYPVGAIQHSGQLFLRCTCPAGQKNACAHANALLIAWLRAPETFRIVHDVEAFGADEFFPDRRVLLALPILAGDDAERDADGREVEDWEDDVLPPAAKASRRPLASPILAGAVPPLRLRSGQGFDPRAEYVELLNLLTVPVLRDVARRRGVAIAGNRKGPIVEALAEALSRPGALAEAWPALSPEARTAAGCLPMLETEPALPISAGYGVHPHKLSATLRALGAQADGGLDAVGDELSRAGLAFRSSGGTLRFSKLLGMQLPPDPDFIPGLPDDARFDAVPAPAPGDFGRLAVRVLLTLQAGGNVVARPAPERHRLQRGRPGLADWPLDPEELDEVARERNVNYALHSRDFTLRPQPPLLADESARSFGRAVGAVETRHGASLLEYVLRLLVGLDLVRLPPGRRAEVVTAHATEFLNRSPLERALLLFVTSVALNTWTEFDRLHGQSGAPRLRRAGGAGHGQSYAHLLEAFSAARHMLMLQIRRAPAGRWVDVEALVQRARAFVVNHAVWPVSGAGWYVSLNGRRANASAPADWRASYGPFVEAVVAGPFHWQGVLDLALRSGRLVGFRVTDFGARLLGQTTRYEMTGDEGAGPALRFEADPAKTGGASHRLILRVAAATSETIVLLALLGEAVPFDVVSPRSGGGEGELVYRLTAEGAARAFEAGWDPDRLLAALEQAAHASPPETLVESIRKWWRDFGTLHLYQDVALVELADDYALPELLAGTALAQHLLYRFGPRLIAVRPEGVEALRAELVKKGYTPKLADGLSDQPKAPAIL